MCPPPEMRDEPQSGVGPGELSDTALTLDHENPGFTEGMSDMLRTDCGMEHIARLEDGAVLHAPVSIPHFQNRSLRLRKLRNRAAQCDVTFPSL